MPSKGSPQVAVRMPQEMIDAIDACVESRNRAMAHDREWNRADWLIEAITEKLNKTGYGRKQRLQIKAIKVDDNMPRELEGDLESLM